MKQPTTRSWRALAAAAPWVCTLLFLNACGGGHAAPRDGAADDASTGDAGCRSELDCDDGLFCNGEEACLDGECVTGAPVLCADDLDCTNDRCDEDRRGCVYEAPDEDGDGHATVECGGDDCDDADADRYPGNAEVCDAEDHDEDCDPTTFGVRDADGDGWPDATCCNLAADGGRVCGDDCDDALPTAHPSEAESCDGVDNDCDGEIDEGVERTFYVDADGDHHGDPDGVTATGCYPPEGYAEAADDCDDAHASAHPGGSEVCDADGVDEDCDGTANPASLCNCSAGATSACDLPGVCAAGTRSCVGGSWGACSIAGGAETCNGLDDDCDGVIDELLRVTCFADDDEDGVAAPGAVDSALCPVTGREAFGGCPVDFTDRTPLGASNLDCDDADPSRSPDEVEICDGVDNDCDGAVDEGVTVTCYTDADRDGAPVGSAREVCPAAGGACPAGMTSSSPASVGPDCDDRDPNRFPGNVEVCDDAGVDEDCDGAVNEGLDVVCYPDGDGDGFAPDGAAGTHRCPADLASACPAGTTITAPVNVATIDCDDRRADVNPGAPEVCDHVDNNCVGGTDEGVAVPGFVDSDGDGFGDETAATTGCLGDPNFSLNGADCNDGAGTTLAIARSIYPGSGTTRTTPVCPGGWPTCTLRGLSRDGETGQVRSLDLILGCANPLSGTCTTSVSFWDFDCSGTVDSADPVASATCTSASTCSVDADCTGTDGYHWSNAPSQPPCGISDRARPDLRFRTCGCGSGCLFSELGATRHVLACH